MSSQFFDEISLFYSNIRSLDTTLPFVAAVLNSSRKQAKSALKSYLEENAVKKENDEENPKITTYTLPAEHGLQLRHLTVRASSAELAVHKVPESFIVTLISQYDAFLGNLVRALYLKKPELINTSEKKMSFSEIIAFSTIDDARQFAVEREVDALIRESHAAQIAWLERKLGITLTKDLPIWPSFIEITERRNLFVHTGGKVTSQYIDVCNEFKADIPKGIKIGDSLKVERSYFDRACDTVLELGIKLGHVLWRKVAEEEREAADTNLNLLCYELIQAEEYHLAISLLEFATETIKKHSSEEILMFMLVNKAQAYKWSGDMNRCNKILDAIDWSTKAPKYHLVRCVLKDQFDEAAKIMKSIGNQGDITIPHYVEWPVLQKFRQTDIFKSTYQEVFSTEFQVVRTTGFDSPDVRPAE